MASYYVVVCKNEDGSYESLRGTDCVAFRSRFDAAEIARKMAVPWRYIVVEVEHDD